MNSGKKTEVDNGSQVADGELTPDELDKVSAGGGNWFGIGDTPTSQLVSAGAATGAAGGTAVFGSSVPGGADGAAGAAAGAGGGVRKPA